MGDYSEVCPVTEDVLIGIWEDRKGRCTYSNMVMKHTRNPEEYDEEDPSSRMLSVKV